MNCNVCAESSFSCFRLTWFACCTVNRLFMYSLSCLVLGYCLGRANTPPWNWEWEWKDSRVRQRNRKSADEAFGTMDGEGARRRVPSTRWLCIKYASVGKWLHYCMRAKRCAEKSGSQSCIKCVSGLYQGCIRDASEAE
jgi:hypothetical protein